MSSDLVFEVGTEELPAAFVPMALRSIEANLKKSLEEAGVSWGAMRTLGTPRRLAVIIEELIEKQPDRVQEIKGPSIKVAYTEDGKPSKALEGFLRSQGLKLAELETRAVGKGEYVFAEKKVKGRKTKDVLPEMLSAALRRIPFPKAMRWGERDTEFARPMHWIAAVYGGKTLKVSYGHVKSRDVTYGHRFHKNRKPIKVTTPGMYVADLKAANVVVDPLEREALIKEGIEKEAARVKGRVVEDAGLLKEVTHLVEYPVVIMGSFDEEFLKLPREVVVSAMREHQRYFSVEDKKGNLKTYFITVANTPVKDKDVVRKGNERVLRARLNDARFYFEKDVLVELTERVKELKGVVFQSRLGTSYEKVERFTRLALFLGEKTGFSSAFKGSIEDILKSEKTPGGIDGKELKSHYLGRAAVLSKADLVSGMVGEFPSLQGVMGREYALMSGEATEVSEAILEHYMPLAAGAKTPSSMIGALVSIADKLDTMAGCFGVGLIPTGAADPYALRRGALGIIAIIRDRELTLDISEMVEEAVGLVGAKLTREATVVSAEVTNFIMERLRRQLLSEGIGFDAVDAAFSVESPLFDILDTIKRVRALESFKSHAAAESLTAAFKRVSNILKGQDVSGDVDEALLTDEAERVLFSAVTKAGPKIATQRRTGEYVEALEELASIRDSIDRFFDDVMVMVEDKALSKNRLKLLLKVRGLYADIAELSKLTK